ncbi:MAG: hypothetical protein IKW92_06100 [Firmicutes bacterium]|jgi:hypothetical protein|nr:hypothetical protein [Bacillota bacterium]
MFRFLKNQGPPGPADPKLLAAVKAYIDAHFVPEVQEELMESVSFDYAPVEQKKFVINHSYSAKKASYEMSAPAAAAPAMGSAMPQELDEVLRHTDAGFSETLLKLIDRSGEKDSTIYKRANVDRRLFSKIRSNPGYKPSKSTAVAFAIALQLNVEETNDLIGRAGYVLSHSSEADLIAEYFINNKDYDIVRLNEVLYACDQPLLGGA